MFESPNSYVDSPESSTAADGMPELVLRVRRGSRTAIEELYLLIREIAGPRYSQRLSPGDLQDCLHETFLIVVEAVKTGALRKPDSLAPFIRTVLRYQAAASVRGAIRKRRQISADEIHELRDGRNNPEDIFLKREKKQLLVRSIQNLHLCDREILSRFYLDGQPRE
jgi:DNA-directed RNA polymerase specialized sigma24 family protein